MNAIVIGLAIDADAPRAARARLPLGARIALVPPASRSSGSAAGSTSRRRLGPGPRDGLMTGLHRVTGLSLRVVRAGIEVSAVAIGFAARRHRRRGHVAFALAIGPAVQAAVYAFGGRDTATL